MKNTVSSIPTLKKEDVAPLLPPRPKDSHKGKNGYALLCVGSAAYTGAALLSAAAALRVGCGVLEAAVPGSVKGAFSALPEACCTPVNDGGVWDGQGMERAAERMEGKGALGLGCGMGWMEDTRLVDAALATGLPLVVDADGLNLLSRRRELLARLHEKVILTPHPGEMARLAEVSVQEVAADPAGIAAQAARDWRCIVLLKGAESYISDGSALTRNATGNPGLAKGGSGDVLAGMIVGLLSQGLAPLDAACAGAYLLGSSADTALSLLGSRMLMAGDVIGAVEMALNQLRQ